MGRRTYGGGPHAGSESPADIQDANTEFAAQAKFGFIYDCRHATSGMTARHAPWIILI